MGFRKKHKYRFFKPHLSDSIELPELKFQELVSKAALEEDQFLKQVIEYAVRFPALACKLHPGPIAPDTGVDDTIGLIFSSLQAIKLKYKEEHQCKVKYKKFQQGDTYFSLAAQERETFETELKKQLAEGELSSWWQAWLNELLTRDYEEAVSSSPLVSGAS